MTDGSRWVDLASAALVSSLVISLAISCGGGAGSPNATQPGASRPYPAPQVATTGSVLAKAGPVVITTDELGKRLGQQGPVMMDRMADPARRKQFLQEQVRFELIAQEAWAKGLQDHPDVIQDLKKAIVQRYIRDELDRRASDQNISDADLAASYQAAFDEYNKPETVRLSQIVRAVSNDADRKKAHALLEKLKAEILAAEKKNKPNAFAEAARDNSQDEGTRFGGGELQFMNRKELEAKYGPEVAKAAFEQAQVGDMVIADASDATVLFKKTGLRRAVERTLEMVKPQVRARVVRDRKNAAFEVLFADLEKKYGVSYDEDALAKMELGTKGAATSTGAAH
jgi:parvulin-like peptidyl-prolyl isomerase